MTLQVHFHDPGYARVFSLPYADAQWLPAAGDLVSFPSPDPDTANVKRRVERLTVSYRGPQWVDVDIDCIPLDVLANGVLKDAELARNYRLAICEVDRDGKLVKTKDGEHFAERLDFSVGGPAPLAPPLPSPGEVFGTEGRLWKEWPAREFAYPAKSTTGNQRVLVVLRCVAR